MLWFWLVIPAAVYGLVIALRSVKKDRYRHSGDWLVIPFAGLFGAGILMAILALALNGLFLWVLDGNNKPTVREIKIVQITTGSQVRGDFFLGSGYIDSRPVYSYYRDDDGAISQDYIPADFYTKIYQDETSPRVVAHGNEPRQPWLSVFNTRGTGYEVHVPAGSIASGVDLNLTN